MSCPVDQALARYTQNELDGDQTRAVDRHLSECRKCLDKFVALGRRSPVPEIPGCRIVKELGRGRFGIVYKAWSLNGTPKIVALKILSYPGEMESSRFEREIAVLRRIDSSGVVKCLDAGTSGDSHYLIMDFVEGVHLDEYFSQDAPVAQHLTDKLRVFQKICRAVADAHAVGVVHRDLKPRNIIVDASGQPHVLDFGICLVEPSDWSSWLHETITHAGDVIGTLRYMSPEQAWGGVAGAIDERSDLWALGIILYEIVTDGGYPYPLIGAPDQPVHEALLNRIRKELPHLPKLDHLPRGGDLSVLLERCLVWEPRQRVSSASILADDVARYCEGQPVVTRPLGPLYRAKRLAIGAATRSRFAFSASFVAAVGIIIWAAMFVAPIGWQVDGQWYQQPGRDTVFGPISQTRERVCVIGIGDETPKELVLQAQTLGLADVSLAAPTWRPVHSHLMQRLVHAKPKAVVWDFFFKSAQPHDEGLVASVLALEEAGVPVTLAASRYQADGSPQLAPALLDGLGPRLRHGAIVARNMVERPGEFIMAVKRKDGVVIPSLPLAAVASVIMPEARLELDLPTRDDKLYMLHRLRPGAYARVRNELETTKGIESKINSAMVRVGDTLAVSSFLLDAPEQWSQRTTVYEDVLSASDEQLAERFRDKVVIVGDLRTRRFGFIADRHDVKYGRTIERAVPGCYLIADAVAGLLGRRQKVWAMPPPPSSFLSMLGIAALATLASIRLAKLHVFDRTSNRSLVAVGLMLTGGVCLAAMASLDTYWSVHAAMAGMSAAWPMAGALLVEFARNRHRIADRARREIETLQLSSDGTLTLAPQQPTSLTRM